MQFDICIIVSSFSIILIIIYILHLIQIKNIHEKYANQLQAASGFLINKDIRKDSGGNAWMVFPSEGYMFLRPVNERFYNQSLYITYNNVEEGQVQSFHHLPPQINIKHYKFNDSPYYFVAIPSTYFLE